MRLADLNRKSYTPRAKFRPHLTPLPCSKTNASLSPRTVRSSAYSPMSPLRSILNVPPSDITVQVALQTNWFLCPSFHWYSLSRGISSRKSPIALWLTNLITSFSIVKSQLGQAADIAILRWNMPTPVALKNSSKPKVSTHFQLPTSGLPLAASAVLAGGFVGAIGSTFVGDGAGWPSSGWSTSCRRNMALSGAFSEWMTAIK
mmetsp:Transcript_1311/g.3953  ORF Transcript_1311/g.3953 Transcript_1311/m.3953 type:complete len:203 (-) Transcript_1311:984-1592(-)